MTHAIVLLISLGGFLGTCLTMERHQPRLLARAPGPATNRALRGAAFSLLALSLAVAVHGMGWAFGLVAWFGHLSLAAGLVFLWLVWRNRAIR